MEYLDTSKRSLVGNLSLALCLTLSGAYQPWVIKYLGDWKTFNWIMFSQIGLVFFAPLILPESARWLMLRGKVDRMVRTLKWIAKLNNKKVNQLDIHQLIMNIYKHFKLSDTFEEDIERLCQKQKKIVESKSVYQKGKAVVSYLVILGHPQAIKIFFGRSECVKLPFYPCYFG